MSRESFESISLYDNYNFGRNYFQEYHSRLSRGDIKLPDAQMRRIGRIFQRSWRSSRDRNWSRRLCRTRESNDSARRYFMTRTREQGETRMAGITFGKTICRSHERSGAMHNDGTFEGA